MMCEIILKRYEGRSGDVVLWNARIVSIEKTGDIPWPRQIAEAHGASDFVDRHLLAREIEEKMLESMAELLGDYDYEKAIKLLDKALTEVEKGKMEVKIEE